MDKGLIVVLITSSVLLLIIILGEAINYLEKRKKINNITELVSYLRRGRAKKEQIYDVPVLQIEDRSNERKINYLEHQDV